MKALTTLLPLVLAIGCGPQLPPIGQSWAVDTTSATWVEPESADSLTEVFATIYPFYIGFHEVEDDQATFLLVIGDDDGQDFCSRTVRMNNITINKDLSFSYGPEDFTVANGFTTESLYFSGQISEDFATISDISFTGNLNLGTAPEELFAMEGFDLTTCELVEVFDMTCGPCADGSSECLQAEVTDATAAAVPELSLIEIGRPDCHAQCDVSAENEDCDL
jgi:hypothetical protein